MKISYDPGADVLYLHLMDASPVDADEEADGVIFSYAEAGEIVTVEFLDASKRSLVNGGSLSATLETLVGEKAAQ